MGQKQTVLEKRYFRGDEKTEFDLFRRVSNFLGNTPEQSESFYQEMANHRFMPNTPCLVNAGVDDSSGQLFACFVLPIEDSMDDIFTTLRHTALIHKTGGGTGFNFSKLRPKDAKVRSSNGVASGPITFMQAYDASTETVKQGGVRRGANMACFSIHHPDVQDFILCKDDLSSLQNFNISVALDAQFMSAVRNDDDWQFSFGGHDIGEPVKARMLMGMIVTQAWKNGEPGILFLDRINELHPLPDLIESTNPCGEQPLLPFEACCLGSINLSAFVDGTTHVFDTAALDRTITVAVDCLNAMLDHNIYPVPEIKVVSEKNRKIGLGVMGYADMLIKMGLKYGTDEALEFTALVAKQIQDSSHAASSLLGQTFGSFPNFERSTFKRPMRNATVTTIAPTGTISVISECSSGIEPIFSPVTIIRRVDSVFVEIHPLFESMLKAQGSYDRFLAQFDNSQLKSSGKNIASEPRIEDYLPEIADYIINTHDVTPDQHIKTQAVWQMYTDNAVSKTINLPKDATKDDVYDAYMLAYDLGCKGLTVYRDGSRVNQVLSTSNSYSTEFTLRRGDVAPSNDKAVGRKRKIRTGCGNLHCQAWFDSKTGALHEVFLNKGSTGGCNSYMSGLSRMISLAARSGCDIYQIVDQLESSLECASYVARRVSHHDTSPGKSCPTAIAKVIIELYNEIQTEMGFSRHIELSSEVSSEGCVLCGAPVKHESGCTTCTECGFSSCG